MLKPFKEVTAQVSAELYVTSSAICPLLCHLTENALKIELTNPIAIKKFKTEMRNNLQSRYRSESIMCMLNHACSVDPRFKTMPFLDDSERKILHDDIVGEMELLETLQINYCALLQPVPLQRGFFPLQDT